ncbi:T9SS type A sorting domain-containing protein [Tunicatimonas pelagia]|uniref:T9SS type A sorting domain-containing protein n=1 Tax=Tunicatimonas pelagia TaxID=931531 RepID=UPI002666981A|nr:T9SS type A sorting domain-containing protein [Tunicatimonas pelagia]WKN43306.1 T9SS type A sorting domain-containing protein [Tunicatimonas pelagia]
MTVFLLVPIAYAQGQVFDWALGSGGWTDDYTRDITVDHLGYVYVTGYVTNASIGDTILRDNGAFVMKLSNKGQVVWAKSFGQFDTSGVKIKVDSQGNVFLLGKYSHGFTVEGHTVYSTGIGLFLMKIDVNGTILFLKNYSTPRGNGRALGEGLAIDEQDNVYVGGHFNNFLVLGDSTYHVRGRQGFDHDLLLIKFSNEGEVLWVRTPGSNQKEFIHDVAVDSHGVYLVGDLSGRIITFEESTFQAPISGLGFVAKYTLDGEYQWAEVFHSPNHSRAFSVAVDHQGNVYASGIWTVRNYVHRSDKFIAKLSNEGQLLFTRFVEFGPTYTLKSGVTTNGTDVYFTSGLAAPYKAGHIQSDSSSTEQAAILKFSEIGYPQWLKLTEGSSNDEGVSIAVDGKAIFLAGNYKSDTLHLDASYTVNNSGNSDKDFFLAGAKDTTDNICPDPSSFTLSHVPNFCHGDSARLVIENPYAVYTEWYKDGRKLNFDNQRSIYVKQPGLYSVKINSNTRCPGIIEGVEVDLASNRTEDTDVVIHSNPISLFKYDSVTVCLGEKLILEVDYHPEYTYMWRNLHILNTDKNKATIITGATDTSFVILQIKNTVTSCSNQDTLYLISTAPPSLTVMPLGDSLVASGSLNYEWYFNGRLLEEFDGHVSVFPEENGYYKVGATNEAGCYSESDSVLVELVLGLEETPEDIRVYPVPFESKIYIKSTQTVEKATLMNINGKEVKSFPSAKVLEADDVRPGVYLLKIHTSSRIMLFKIQK